VHLRPLPFPPFVRSRAACLHSAQLAWLSCLPTGLGWLCSLTLSCRSHPSARSCPLPWPRCSLFPCCSCPRALC
jgi:hypothetical protein